MDKLPDNTNRKKGVFEMSNHSRGHPAECRVPRLNFYTPVGVDSSETSGRYRPRIASGEPL
jgi:hypothetical protein